MGPTALAYPRLSDIPPDKGKRGGNENRELKGTCRGDWQATARLLVSEVEETLWIILVPMSQDYFECYMK